MVYSVRPKRVGECLPGTRTPEQITSSKTPRLGWHEVSASKDACPAGIKFRSAAGLSLRNIRMRGLRVGFPVFT